MKSVDSTSLLVVRHVFCQALVCNIMEQYALPGYYWHTVFIHMFELAVKHLLKLVYFFIILLLI